MGAKETGRVDGKATKNWFYLLNIAINTLPGVAP